MVQQPVGKSGVQGPTVEISSSPDREVATQGMEIVLRVHEVPVNFLVDMGASLTILRPDIYITKFHRL